MKKLLLMPLLALFAIASCSDDKDEKGEELKEAKLVKEITLDWGHGKDIYSFDYDSQDRIKTLLWTVSNDNGDSHTTYSYSYGSNTITVKRTETGNPDETEVLTLDGDGYLTQVKATYGDDSEDYAYSYSNGYLTKMTSSDGYDETYTWQNGNLVDCSGQKFTYNTVENKLNVNHSIYIEELYITGSRDLPLKGITNANYPISADFGNIKITYQYEYDDDGYPNKITGSDGYIVTFSYY